MRIARAPPGFSRTTPASAPLTVGSAVRCRSARSGDRQRISRRIRDTCIALPANCTRARRSLHHRALRWSRTRPPSRYETPSPNPDTVAHRRRKREPEHHHRHREAEARARQRGIPRLKQASAIGAPHDHENEARAAAPRSGRKARAPGHRQPEGHVHRSCDACLERRHAARPSTRLALTLRTGAEPLGEEVIRKGSLTARRRPAPRELWPDHQTTRSHMADHA